MVALEQAANVAGYSYAQMMEAAGGQLAQAIQAQLPLLERPARLLFLIGKGNNGGDGLVAARLLQQAQPALAISAYLAYPRQDALLTQAQAVGVSILSADSDPDYQVLKASALTADVLVDGLLGTGFRLPLKPDLAALLAQLQVALAARPHPPLCVAVDCPSGVECDSGLAAERVIWADLTVTFQACKRGLLEFPAVGLTGHLKVVDIGIPITLDEWKAIKGTLMDITSMKALLPARPNDAHKGTFGKAFIVAGSVNYIGAAYLAAGAAYRVGAGLVTLGVPQPLVGTLAGMIPEATWTLLPHDLGIVNKGAAEVVHKDSQDYDALLVGPGIGDEDETQAFIEALLKPDGKSSAVSAPRRIGLLGVTPTDEEKKPKKSRKKTEGGLPPLVLDADGLNALSKVSKWAKLLPANSILTPHPRELARLLGLEETESVLKDRQGIAAEKAKEWNAIIVLKGAHTVIAAPDGQMAVSPFATAKLATAGTGDVLAGVITGLLAQGLAPFEAARLGVWLHGWAGQHGVPAYGALASDVMKALGSALEATHQG
jgi:NAD(P)H-hydrate epimerase